MLFNSFEYIIFLLAVFVLFVATNRKQTLLIRNFILLAASWYFYSCLHWWFVLLLLYTTTVNYLCGRWIGAAQNKGRSGKAGAAVSIILSLAILIVFKYAYVFDSSILLPVGLSFFTFQALTYTIDIYRKKISVENNPINVALFISFFPTLLSGPIERARNLLPQFRKKNDISWDNITSGAGLFVWGLFKKVVIADRLAQYVNLAYLNPEGQSGSTLAVAAVFYSFQIYCDFSGYADMAIASGRILGFRIMQNFNFPYYVNTIKEFWRRWHISLTSWFTEYVYISMGGNRVIKPRWILNISAVFLLSGIWHGAGWLFLIWGMLHGGGILVHRWWKNRPAALAGWKIPHLIAVGMTFFLVNILWVFFRSTSLVRAISILKSMFSFQTPVNLSLEFRWAVQNYSEIHFYLLLLLFSLSLASVFLLPNSNEIVSKTLRHPALQTAITVICCVAGILCIGRGVPFLYFNF